MKSYKIAVDENIFIKDEICPAGSKMLYNFKSPYSATVIEKIKGAGAGFEIAAQSKTAEFGSAAGHGLTDTADIALGIDVDGAAYMSAVKNNLFYIKPTYGTVSRFGVAANVSSVDQVGVYAKNLEDGFSVLSVIAGHDKNDGTTYPAQKYDYAPAAGILKTAKFSDIDFKYADCLAEVYFIISAAEFSSNISRFDGLKFGYRTEDFRNINDMVINSRSEGFTTETKLRLLMGAYVLSEGQFEKYYLKATRLRRLIKQELDVLFKTVDVIIHTVPDSGASYYDRLKFSALANLTGRPAVIMPGPARNGLQIIAKEFNEDKLFAFGKELLKDEL